ncbi:MAG: glucosamine-6-phosphate deaminase [Clostridia bacterium]|nr:glucosamine-6-phosphate deaminase [Clostridia bacterium]
MRIIVVENYEEMSAKGAELFVEVMTAKKNCVIGLATGSTPIGLYNNLAKACAEGKVDFSEVTSVNLDEYYPLAPDNDQSYRYFMNKNLFDKVNIKKENTFVPDGTAKDPEAACKEYEQRIDALGGIDIQVLGIGRNGHIGFNEPDANGLFAETHLTALTENTIEANSRFFASADEVPKHALTMGIGSVFKARKIVIMANGADKADAIKKMVEGPISTMCPASLLCLHPDVTLICDKSAYSLVK